MTLLVHTTLFFLENKRRWLLGNWLKTVWWKHWAVSANSRSEDSVLICEQWVKKESKTFKTQSLFFYCKWWILDKQPSKADLKGLYINGYSVPLVDTFQKLQSLSSLWETELHVGWGRKDQHIYKFTKGWKQWSNSDGKLSTVMIHVNNSNQSVWWNDQFKNGKQGEHAILKGWHHEGIIPGNQEHLTKEVLSLVHHFPFLLSTEGSERFLCIGFHTQCLSPSQNASPRRLGSAVSFVAEGISDVAQCLLCREFSVKTKMRESEWTSTQ